MDDLDFLRSLLEEMIQSDAAISFRQVSERSDGRFPHATSLTRKGPLRATVQDAVARQKAVREVARKFSKSSPARLAERVLALEAEVRELKGQRELLIASHRAAILAIGRIGGLKAWRDHFPAYSEAMHELEKLNALPVAEVRQLKGNAGE